MPSVANCARPTGISASARCPRFGGPSMRATVIPLPSSRIWNRPVATIAPVARGPLPAPTSPPCRDDVMGGEVAVTATLGPGLVPEVEALECAREREVLRALVARDDLG